MSVEESEDALASAAVATQVPEQTDNEQPPIAKVATAVPAVPTVPTATAVPASDSEVTNYDNSGIDATENSEGVVNKTEKQVEEKFEYEQNNPKSSQLPPPPDHSYDYSRNKSTQLFPFPSFLYDTFLMLFILIGMVFVLIGGILSGTSVISNNIDVYGASIITISLGLFTIATFLILAALFRNDFNNQLRLGLLIVGAFSILGIVVYSTHS